MHDMMRTTIGLLMTSLVLLPGATAGPSIGLEVDASVAVDAQAYADRALAAADEASARAEAALGEVRAEAAARASDAAAAVEAEASAKASAGGNAAQRALAGIGGAFQALGEMAAGLFARIDLSARVG